MKQMRSNDGGGHISSGLRGSISLGSEPLPEPDRYHSRSMRAIEMQSRHRGVHGIPIRFR